MKREIVITTNKDSSDKIVVFDDYVDYVRFLSDFVTLFNKVPLTFEVNKDKSTTTESILTLNIKMDFLKISDDIDILELKQNYRILETFYDRQHLRLFDLFYLDFLPVIETYNYSGNVIFLIPEGVGTHFVLTPKTSYKVPEKLLLNHFDIVNEEEDGFKVKYKHLTDVNDFFWALRKDISDSSATLRNDQLGCNIPLAVVDALVDFPNNQFNIETNVIYTSQRDLRKVLKPKGEQLRVNLFNSERKTPTACMFIYKPSLFVLNKALTEAIPDYKLEYVSEKGIMQDINVTLPGNSNYLRLKRFEELYISFYAEEVMKRI